MYKIRSKLINFTSFSTRINTHTQAAEKVGTREVNARVILEIKTTSSQQNLLLTAFKTNFRPWQQPLCEVSASQGRNHNNQPVAPHGTRYHKFLLTKKTDFGFEMLFNSNCDNLNY